MVKEVGEDNIVQVVIDSKQQSWRSNVMVKRKGLFWTPCDAHCYDLMLEDYDKKIPINGETIPQDKRIPTKFA